MLRIALRRPSSARVRLSAASDRTSTEAVQRGLLLPLSFPPPRMSQHRIQISSDQLQRFKDHIHVLRDPKVICLPAHDLHPGDSQSPLLVMCVISLILNALE